MAKVKSGFTLIELLVVVAILGILAAIGIVSFSGFLNTSKVTVAKGNHTSLVSNIESVWLKCILNPEGVYEDLVVTNIGGIKGINCATENSWGDVFFNHFEGKNWKNPYNTKELAVSMEYNDDFPATPGKSNIRYFHNTVPPSLTIKTRWGAADGETSSKTLLYE